MTNYKLKYKIIPVILNKIGNVLAVIADFFKGQFPKTFTSIVYPLLVLLECINLCHNVVILRWVIAVIMIGLYVYLTTVLCKTKKFGYFGGKELPEWVTMFLTVSSLLGFIASFIILASMDINIEELPKDIFIYLITIMLLKLVRAIVWWIIVMKD